MTTLAVLSDLIDGFGTVLTPENLAFAAIGVLLGTFVGVLPGIGPALTIALLLPITFNFEEPTGAFIMFAGIYFGGMYGGSTTSILLNTPGESASVATAIEGYEMAKRGRGGPALATAAIGSFVAGTIGILLLTFLAEPVADLAVQLQPADYFALTVLAFVSVTALVGRSLIRGMLSLFIGLFIGLIGIDQVSGQSRLTFGVNELNNGVDIVLVAVGLFAVGEALYVASRLRHKGEEELLEVEGAKTLSREDVRRSWKPWLRGTALGFPFGAMPTGGAEIPTFLSYAVERRLARGKAKEEFGKGAIEGVAGPEAANNAAFTGVLVPLLTIGIPTSATAAILVAAFQIFDLQPGPQLFTQGARPRVGADRVAVRRQRDAAAAQPAARAAVGEGARDPARCADRRHPRVRHARRLLDLGLGHRADRHVRDRRARLLHAPLRLPGRAGHPRRDPRAADGGAVPAHAAGERRRLRRLPRPPVRGRPVRARDPRAGAAGRGLQRAAACAGWARRTSSRRARARARGGRPPRATGSRACAGCGGRACRPCAG